MKIAFITQPWERALAPDVGSIEILTIAAARFLAQEDSVFIFARGGGAAAGRETRDGVQYLRFPVIHEHKFLSPLWRLSPTPGVPLVASRFYGAFFIHQAARHLAELNCDIVHVHNFSQFIPVIRRFNPSVKIVLHMHCEWLTQFDRETLARRLRIADAIIGCSRHVTKGIRTRFPELAAKCHTILNAVDVDHFQRRAGTEQPPAKRKSILFVGRISPEKGVHVLVESFLRVAECFPDAELNIVGADCGVATLMHFELNDDALTRELSAIKVSGYADRIRKLIPRNVHHRVKFSGFVSHAHLPGIYHSHDILVSPSVCHEAFCLPVAEAMAAGLPVVGTRSGGVQEQIVSGKTGILVERGNVADLTQAIEYLLGKPLLRSSMGDAGRARAAAMFSWHVCVPEWRRLYSGLLEDRLYRRSAS
jgi:glycosyltransferase involved in cell wall biosynthesis